MDAPPQRYSRYLKYTGLSIKMVGIFREKITSFNTSGLPPCASGTTSSSAPTGKAARALIVQAGEHRSAPYRLGPYQTAASSLAAPPTRLLPSSLRHYPQAGLPARPTTLAPTAQAIRRSPHSGLTPGGALLRAPPGVRGEDVPQKRYRIAIFSLFFKR
ncbi:hypothetical protein C5O22_06225 [Treponema sp. J25]|nr:hypothetical protein C5O22_06225 [Treponema sp. J25]